MKLLLDTHILLWWMLKQDALSQSMRSAITSPDAEVFISAATVWEISIKVALGKLDFPPEPIDRILRNLDFAPLPISMSHAVKAGALPRHHADPFDRMLISQAILENMTLVSIDPAMRRYEVALLV